MTFEDVDCVAREIAFSILPPILIKHLERDDVPKSWLVDAADHEIVNVRARAARHLLTPLETLGELARSDPDPTVRALARQNMKRPRLGKARGHKGSANPENTHEQ